MYNGESTIGARGLVPPSWLVSTMCSPYHFLFLMFSQYRFLFEMFSCPVEPFLFRMLVVFCCGELVIQSLLLLSETGIGMGWSSAVLISNISKRYVYMLTVKRPTIFYDLWRDSSDRTRGWMPSGCFFFLHHGRRVVVATQRSDVESSEF